MTILVDMDDVMTNLLEVWTKFLGDIYGVYVNKDDIKEWDMRVAYPTLTSEQIYSVTNDERLWKEVRPIPGAVEYLQALKYHDGHDIYIVTAAHYGSIEYRVKHVIEKYFPFIPYENVIVASRKQMVIGDFLIDDNPLNLISGTYKGILFDAVHNREFNTEKFNIVRAKSWEGVYNIIQKFELEGWLKFCNEVKAIQ